MEDAIPFGALGNLPGALAWDLTVAPPASNGSSSSSSSSSSYSGCPDGVSYSLVRMCHAGDTSCQQRSPGSTTSCLEKLAGSVGTKSLPLVGCALAEKVCERHFQLVPFQELSKWHACPCSDQEGEEEEEEGGMDGHQDCGVVSQIQSYRVEQEVLSTCETPRN